MRLDNTDLKKMKADNYCGSDKLSPLYFYAQSFYFISVFIINNCTMRLDNTDLKTGK